MNKERRFTEVKRGLFSGLAAGGVFIGACSNSETPIPAVFQNKCDPKPVNSQKLDNNHQLVVFNCGNQTAVVLVEKGEKLLDAAFSSPETHEMSGSLTSTGQTEITEVSFKLIDRKFREVHTKITKSK